MIMPADEKGVERTVLLLEVEVELVLVLLSVLDENGTFIEVSLEPADEGSVERTVVLLNLRTEELQ